MGASLQRPMAIPRPARSAAKADNGVRICGHRMLGVGPTSTAIRSKRHAAPRNTVAQEQNYHPFVRNKGTRDSDRGVVLRVQQKEIDPTLKYCTSSRLRFSNRAIHTSRASHVVSGENSDRSELPIWPSDPKLKLMNVLIEVTTADSLRGQVLYTTRSIIRQPS